MILLKYLKKATGIITLFSLLMSLINCMKQMKMPVRFSYLETFHGIKNSKNNHAIRSIVAIGTFSILHRNQKECLHHPLMLMSYIRTQISRWVKCSSYIKNLRMIRSGDRQGYPTDGVKLIRESHEIKI